MEALKLRFAIYTIIFAALIAFIGGLTNEIYRVAVIENTSYEVILLLVTCFSVTVIASMKILRRMSKIISQVERMEKTIGGKKWN